MYKLFIDDLRHPVTDDWVVARSSLEAINIVLQKGFPVEIAFDHDLGGDDTSMKFLWWLSGYMMDNKTSIPEQFVYTVHSQNPVGVSNIHSFMHNLQSVFNG